MHKYKLKLRIQKIFPQFLVIIQKTTKLQISFLLKDRQYLCSFILRKKKDKQRYKIIQIKNLSFPTAIFQQIFIHLISNNTN
jgi:hypothetical protein